MNMYRKRRLNAFIGQVLASYLIVQNVQRYRREHITDHHAVHHMTLRDPTVQAFLLTLDVHPGMARSKMRRRILGKILSPVFHVRFAIARLRSFWSGSTLLEKALFLLFHGGAVLACVLAGQATALVAVWYVPLFPLFQVSNVLRLCVKHSFPAPKAAERRGREYFASLTSAVFIGEAPPPPGLPRGVKAWRWAGWWARMVLVHGPTRYLLVTADTPVHDWHHRYPVANDWAHHLYSRQADLDGGCPGWPPYTEQWGFVTAMNNVLDSLSRADPAEYDVRRLRQARGRDLFAAFDD